jgi:hypothetical protein
MLWLHLLGTGAAGLPPDGVHYHYPIVRIVTIAAGGGKVAGPMNQLRTKRAMAAGLGAMVLVALSAAPAAAQIDPESVYAPPTLVLPEEGINEGGVAFDLRLGYVSDYIFRGIRRFDLEDGRDTANMQFDGAMRFDLGRLPHPFAGVFVNIAETDPISRFQEIRPYFGFDWMIRPLTLSAGHTSYIYPDRDDLDTTEIWGKIALDDSVIWDTDRPILRPYVFAAYDYRQYDGWYFEAGVEHEFAIPDTGIALTAVGRVAYVRRYDLFAGPDGTNTGFQHYEFGLVASYTFNTLLNIPRRYGDWRVEGFAFYTDRIDRALRADRELWGGVGIGFRY